MSPMPLGILAAAGAGVAEVVYRIQVFGGNGLDQIKDGYSDQQGNLFLLGATESNGTISNSEDILFLKYNLLGELQFQKVIGTSQDNFVKRFAVDSQKNFYITSNYSPSGHSAAALTKIDENGNVIWTKILDGGDQETYQDIAIDSSDNIYPFGYQRTLTFGEYDFLVVKYDTSGNRQYIRDYGSNERELGKCITVDNNGDYYVSSDSREGGNTGMTTVKFDTNGNVLWQRRLNGGSTDRAIDITYDSVNDNIYLTGHTSSTSSFRDVVIAAYSSSGTLLWQRIYSGGNNDNSQGIDTDSLGNVYVFGHAYKVNTGNNEMLIMKFDSSGSLIWQRQFLGPENQIFFKGHIDSNDNVYAYGQTEGLGQSVPGQPDGIIVVVPNDGSLTGTYSLGGENISYSAGTMSLVGSSLSASSPSNSITSVSLSEFSATFSSINFSGVGEIVEI